MSTHGVWQRYAKLWVPPLVLAILAFGGVAAYNLIFARGARQAAQGLGRNNERVRELEVQRQALSEQAANLKRADRSVRKFFSQTIGDEADKLTRVIAEVKKLAETAGLEINGISYPQDVYEDYQVVKMSFVFTVNGSYVQLRRFVNLVELSDLFLTLEDVGLTRSGTGQGADLRISLRLSTLFRRQADVAEAAS